MQRHISRLYELLTLLFHEDPAHLRRLVKRLPEGADLLDHLPQGAASLAEVVDRTVDELSRRGLVDGLLFSELLAAFPHQERLVLAVADSLGIAGIRVPGARGSTTVHDGPAAQVRALLERLRGDGSTDAAVVARLLVAAGFIRLRPVDERGSAWHCLDGLGPERWCVGLGDHPEGAAAEVALRIDLSEHGVTRPPSSGRTAGPLSWTAALDDHEFSAARLLLAGAELLATSAASGPKDSPRNSFAAQLRTRHPRAFPWSTLTREARRALPGALAALPEYRGAALTVPRRAEEERLEQFVARLASRSDLVEGAVAVLGPQGIGKTSLVCRWLERSDEHPAYVLRARDLDVVFGDGRWRGKGPLGRLLALVKRVNGFRRERPHLLLCIDGLNEGTPAMVGRALDVEDTQKLLRRGVALVLTCWPAHWHRLFRPRLRGEVAVIEVGEFTDEEAELALAARGLSLADLPPALHDLIRRPSLLDHIHRLLPRLSGSTTVTRMDVFWADLQVKAETRWLFAPGDAHGLRQHLIDLMRNYQRRCLATARSRPRVRPEEVARGVLGGPWSELEQKLLTLSDFDVVSVDASNTLVLRDEPIARVAMALLIAQETRLAPDELEAKIEHVKKALDQIGDLAEPAEATENALVVSLALADDPLRTAALAAALLDNRNFDPERLLPLGARIIDSLIFLGSRAQALSGLRSAGGVAREATRLLTSLVGSAHAGRVRALLQSDHRGEVELAAQLMQAHLWPELAEALVDRYRRTTEDEELQMALCGPVTEAYAAWTVAPLLALLEEWCRTRVRPGEAMLDLLAEHGDPALSPALLALAEQARAPGPLLAALPTVRTAKTEARVAAIVRARPARTVAEGAMAWAIRAGSPLVCELLARHGPSAFGAVVFADSTLVHDAARGGWLARLAEVVATMPVDRRRRESASALAWACGHAEGLDAATTERLLRMSLDLDPVLEADARITRHDVAASPERLAATAARLRRILPRPTIGQIDPMFASEIWPELLARDLRWRLQHVGDDAGELAELLERHAQVLLVDDELAGDAVLRATAAHDAMDVSAAALEHLCWRDDAAALRLAEHLAQCEAPPLGVLEPLVTLTAVPEFDASLARWMSQPHPDLSEIALIAAVWSPLRGALPPEIEAWLGRSLLALPADDQATAAAYLVGLRHRGLGGAITQWTRRGVDWPGRLMELHLAAEDDARDRAITLKLLRRYPSESLGPVARKRIEEATPWLADRMPGLAERPDDDSELHELLVAASTYRLPLPAPLLARLPSRGMLRHRDLSPFFFDLLARQPGGALDEALDAMPAGEVASHVFQAVLGRAVATAGEEARVRLLAAVCRDSDPNMGAPRPDVLSARPDDVYTALAKRPVTPAEWSALRSTVPDHAQAPLAWMAALSPSATSWTSELRQTCRSAAVRAAARDAQHLAEQRAALDGLLRGLAADPADAVRSRTVVVLAQRLDATWNHRREQLLASDRFDVRRLAWWLWRSAANRDDERSAVP